MKKPKDRTFIWVAAVGGSIGWEKKEIAVLYKDYEYFEHLPDAAKSDITFVEYQIYWGWRKKNRKKGK